MNVDIKRMRDIAERLRVEIPSASSALQVTLIDAAAELQRLADMAEANDKAIVAMVRSIIIGRGPDDCQCPDCVARRTREATSSSSVN